MSVGPILRTERLGLWRPRRGDLEGIHRLVMPEQTRRFLGSEEPSEKNSFARLLRNAGSWDMYGYGNFMLRFHGSDEIVGATGLFHSFRGFGQGMDDVAEAGWIIHHDHWGKGLAGEAMRAILDWFDDVHGPQRTVCMIEEGHAASDRVARALGYVAYDRNEPEDDVPLILYERFGPVRV